MISLISLIISLTLPVASQHYSRDVQSIADYDPITMKGAIPVVTVEENGRLEELAGETGANEWRFMKNAGMAVSLEAEKMVNFNRSSKIRVLVGKGYNGGNALWAGYLLKQKGYDVEATLLFPESANAAISQEVMTMFKKACGVIQPFDPSLTLNDDLLIDGILGASFKGRASGVLAEAIDWANASKLPILSVDIPSGLNGDTGDPGSATIRATRTVTFFFPRMGFYMGKGLDFVGDLSVVNLGIQGKILSEIHPEAYLVSTRELSKHLASEEVIKLERKKLNPSANLTIQEIQAFSEEQKATLLLTDYPKMLIRPSQKPLIFSDVSLYKFSDTDQIHSIDSFFED